MPEFRVAMRYTIEATGSFTVKAKNEDAATKQAESKAEGILSLTAFENLCEDIDYDIESCEIESIDEE